MKGISELTPNYMHHLTAAEINGTWSPARPKGKGGFCHRVRLALKVFFGKADALVWKNQ